MPKSLSVSWGEGVTEKESQVMLQAIAQTLHWLYFRRTMAFFDPPITVRVYGNWVVPAMVDRHPYWGMQWYVDTSYDRELGRVIAPVYLELVRREPWQRTDAHFDLALLDEDITEFPAPLARLRRDDYALGSSFPGMAAVMSVYRVRRIADPQTRDLTLARLVRHHLGHVLAIPAFDRTVDVARRGLELHCTKRCAMRHADTAEQWAAYALEEAEMGWPFCDLCTQGFHSVMVRHNEEWN